MKEVEFLQMVIVEVDGIKKYATAEEIQKLDFEGLHPSNTHLCIYGQMTGNCYSERAKKIIASCKTLVFDAQFEETFNEMNGTLTGKKKFVISSHEVGRDFTPLEHYIYMRGAKNKQIISYLKGETNTLEL